MRLLVVLALFCATVVEASAAARLRNGIAAIVNEKIITYQEVEDYTFEAVDVLKRTYARTQPEVFEQKRMETMTDGLEQLIERQLILADFKAAGFQLPESIIDDEVKNRVQAFGDRVRLTKTLQAQGTTFESFRKRVYEDFIVNIMRQKNVASAITISPTRIEQFYATNLHHFKVDDQVKLRMIVLNRSEGNSAEELLSMAREIERKLNEGAPFAEMAVTYSKGSQAREGGDWGWYERSKLNKGLAEIASTLQPGQRSGIIGLSREGDTFWVYEYDKSGQIALGRKYSDAGNFLEAKRFDTTGGAEPPLPQEVYLMIVEARRDAHVRPLAEVRDEIEKNLTVQERARLHKKWIDRLKAKAFVTTF